MSNETFLHILKTLIEIIVMSVTSTLEMYFFFLANFTYAIVFAANVMFFCCLFSIFLLSVVIRVSAVPGNEVTAKKALR